MEDTITDYGRLDIHTPIGRKFQFEPSARLPKKTHGGILCEFLTLGRLEPSKVWLQVEPGHVVCLTIKQWERIARNCIGYYEPGEG